MCEPQYLVLNDDRSTQAWTPDAEHASEFATEAERMVDRSLFTTPTLRNEQAERWHPRIVAMERDARTIVRAGGPTPKGVTGRRAAARLARLARHCDIASLRRAHPDHWVANAYLWQLVEAGTLAGADRCEAEERLRRYPRIAGWTAWPHAMVRRFEKLLDSELD